jgi:hypothetical protein
MPCVYRHIRLDKNEPFYIGIGKTEKRAYETIKRNKYWSNIVNNTKYEIEILFNDITWEMAKDKEREFIKLYGRCDINNGILCNLTDGGDGTINRKHTQETKLKMSKSRVGILKSEEWKSKIAESHKGMVITESTRQKLIDSHKGKTMPQEQKDKIRLSLKNRYFSPEHREKISIALKNRKKTTK